MAEDQELKLLDEEISETIQRIRQKQEEDNTKDSERVGGLSDSDLKKEIEILFEGARVGGWDYEELGMSCGFMGCTPDGCPENHPSGLAILCPPAGNEFYEEADRDLGEVLSKDAQLLARAPVYLRELWRRFLMANR